ncbi:MAG: SIR2 family protein, partial [Roseomonas sp.]|nr:SIR2 family protein [Roseomonas sp.]
MKNIDIPSLARSPSGDQELQLAPGLPGLPERLLLAHAQGRVLIIAGAGVSMQPPSCLPDFGSLVRRVFAQLDKAIGAHLDEPTDGRGIGGIKGSLPPLDAEQTAMLGRLGEKEYDVALGMLERRMDRDQERESTVRRAVTGILRETGRHAPIHTSLVRLANRGGAATIATTNFDLLLERAAKALRTPLQRYALHDIPRPSLRPEFAGVLHLHGALDQNPERHPDLVLTDRDFGEHYLRRRAIPDLIYDAARIFHVVLVGYSLGDPPMRYLLNAVAADGQRFSDLKERFAFVGMDWSSDQAASEKRQAELATWKGRGITPIPYDKADGHRALAKVLAAWAKLSPHTAGDNADKEVRRIFRLQRAAASEASAALFGHIFRRSSDEAQVRIAKAHRDGRADPAWLDGMLEIVRETGNTADREAHASRLCQVVLDQRLSDPAMLRWAAQLRVDQAAERRAVLETVQWSLDRTTPEPWRTAWGVIAEAHLATATDKHNLQDYRLKRRVEEGDRSGGLITEVARLVAPRLSVAWRDKPSWPTDQIPKKPSKFNDFLRLSVTSGTIDIGRGLNFERVNDVAFLIELGEALEAEVARGLHIGRRIGWTADRNLVWLGGLNRVRLRGSSEEDEPDRFHRGIAPAVRLLMRTIDRLTSLEPAAARQFLRRWVTRSDPVHVRMWAAAALEPALAQPEEVSHFLMQRTPYQTWAAWQFPEIAELRAVRFLHLSEMDKDSTTGALLRGPPATIFRRRGSLEERRRWRIGVIVRELSRIEAAGASLTQRALRWLSSRRSDFSEFVADTVSVGFPRGVSSESISPKPDTELDGLEGEALSTAVDTRLRSGEGSWSGPASAVWNWLDDRLNALLLAQSLLSTEGSFKRFGKAWNAVGQRFRPPSHQVDQVPDLSDFMPTARQVLHAILLLSDSVLEDAIRGLSDWLESWAQHLRGEAELPVAIAKLWPLAAAASSQTTDATDYKEEEGAEAKRIAHDSLNSPIGDLAGAFLLACPSLAEIRRPFEANADMRVVCDLVADTAGRAGVIARYRCTTALPYLMHADGIWAEAALLSRLEYGPESNILWHAVAHSPLRSNVMARLGQLMARRAVHGALELEIRRSLVDRVCFYILSDMWNGKAINELLPEAQQMLRSIPDELRAQAARAVERFMNDVVQSHVRRQHLWDQIGDFNNGGFLAHRNPKESEDEPKILRPTHAGASRKAVPRYSPRHAQAPFRRGQ